MKKYSAVLLFLFLHGTMLAQMNIDSLRNVLSTEKTDSVTLNKYLDIMARPGAESVEVNSLIGTWVTENALKNKNYAVYTKSLLSRASMYHLASDFINATQFYVETQVAAEKYGQTELGLEALNNLANVYYLNAQYEKAEELYLQTIEACKKYGITIGLASGYGSLGTLYFSSSGNDMAKKRKGIAYMLLSVEASNIIKDTLQLIAAYSSIGKMYTGLEMYDSAMYWVERSGVLLAAKKDNQEGYVHYYRNKGLALLGKKDYKGAIESLLTGIGYTKKYNSPLWESSHYDALAQTYKEMGDYRKALEYTEKHFKIEDSLLNAENFAKASDIQNKYEREKKDKEILKKDLALKTGLAKRNRLSFLLFSSLLILGLLGVFAFVLLKNIRARKKAYQQLEEKNTRIQEQAIELSKQARLIAKFQSQMNPHFTFNALHNIYGLVVTKDNEKAVQQIQSLAALMRQTLTNSVKEEITLEEEIKYLQNYIDFEKATSPAHFDFTVEINSGLEDALIPPMMIQPFIENAVKHAELDKVSNPFVKVLIQKENDLMKLIIEDNGTGINKAAGNLGKLSHSVSIIRSRIEMLMQNSNKQLGDYFSIHPAAGKGTIVEFYLPLNYSH